MFIVCSLLFVVMSTAFELLLSFIGNGRLLFFAFLVKK